VCVEEEEGGRQAGAQEYGSRKHVP